MKLPIFDLHCDLLSYLEEGANRTPYDRIVHCSFPQLKEGGVKCQTLAVFTRTGTNSYLKGNKQIEIFKQLIKKHSIEVCSFDQDVLHSERINLCLAIENASGFCDEKEPLETGLNRLRALYQTKAKPIYISLTWNMENRFGGGNATSIGLKDDGRHLLEELHGKGIAIDLSHASDALAGGILDFIDYKNLSVPILASHSNARKVLDHPRNLPSVFAKEIIRRKGLIGLNFYRHFLGTSESDFVKHMEYWLELGAEKNICFGADFFYEGDTGSQAGSPYFNHYQDAGSYPRLLELLQQKLGLSETILNALAFQNAFNPIYQMINGITFSE
jgi:microsomal dipeptidase-like Zn-dependent dipeptidase